MEILFSACTLLGGITAIWFIWEKRSILKNYIFEKYYRAPNIPLNSSTLFAYANGSSRLRSLTNDLAIKRGFELRNIDSESAWLNEKVSKLEIKTIRELDSYVKKYGDSALKLTDYVTPEGKIDAGLILWMVLEIISIESDGQKGIRELNRDLKHSTGGNKWADEIYNAYRNIKNGS